MKLTLEALEVLDAIDKKGSFAAAAATLHRVPSTVTYTVQKLEEDLDLVIFRRVGRRSVLTPAGSVLLEQGRELLRQAEQMLESARQVNRGWESKLHIALDTLWDIGSFLPLVAEFYRLNTGVQVNLSHEVMGGSLEALTEGRADIVVGGPPPVMQIAGLKFEQIAQSHWQFVVGRDHPLLRQPQPLEEEDIKPFASIVIKDSSISSPIRSHRSFEQQISLKVASMEDKIRATVAGLGVGFLPSHRITDQLGSGELVALSINKAAPDTPQFCSWRSNNKGKAMRWFVDRILQASRVDSA